MVRQGLLVYRTMCINVYVPNLYKRKDRNESIQKEFANKIEFNLKVVKAIEHKVGAWGLWQTFYRIVEKEFSLESPYFIFCEDDHCFTEDYDFDYLEKCIKEANRFDADILSGGMSWFETPVQVGDNLFWVSRFNGMQFVVIFKRFYERILATKTDTGYVTDFHLSRLSHKIFVIFPYISTQKDFGYSDVTKHNNIEERVTKLFEQTKLVLARITALNKYQKLFIEKNENILTHQEVSETYIKTFVINLPERSERLRHFEYEMRGKDEFSITTFQAYKHEVGAVGLWNSICDIVRQAYETDEDAVLICEDDHVFTCDYDRTSFMRKAILAGRLGAELLSGGVAGFDYLVPCGSHGLCWMENFWGTQFIVIYKSAFKKILNADFSIRDVADEKLSEILDRKMVTLPFISTQKEFGYSDVTSSNNTFGKILHHFHLSVSKLKHYKYAINEFVTNLREIEYIKMLPRDYIQKDRFGGLNIECGENILKGWYNTDSNPTYGAHFMDVLKPLPFPNNSLDRVFSQYGIGKLMIKDALSVLQECYRVLKIGGQIRLTLFSLQNLIDLSISDYDKYIIWYKKRLFAKEDNLIQMFSADLPLEFIISYLIQNRDLENLYSYDTIKNILENVGFKDVKRLRYGHSEDPLFKNIEYCPQEIPIFLNEIETISVEAVK